MSQWECCGIKRVTFSRHLVCNTLAVGKPWLKRWPKPCSNRKTGNTRHQHYYGKIVWQKRKIDLSFLMKGSVEKSKISFYSLLRHKFIAYTEEKTQTISWDSPWTAFNDQIMVPHDPQPYFIARMRTCFVLLGSLHVARWRLHHVHLSARRKLLLSHGRLQDPYMWWRHRRSSADGCQWAIRGTRGEEGRSLLFNMAENSLSSWRTGLRG